MPEAANLSALAADAPWIVQVGGYALFFLTFAGAGLFAYFKNRKGPAPPAPPHSSATMQVIGGTLANREAVERLAETIEALTAEIRISRTESTERIKREELKDELREDLMEELRKEMRNTPQRKG